MISKAKTIFPVNYFEMYISEATKNPITDWKDILWCITCAKFDVNSNVWHQPVKLLPVNAHITSCPWLASKSPFSLRKEHHLEVLQLVILLFPVLKDINFEHSVMNRTSGVGFISSSFGSLNQCMKNVLAAQTKILFKEKFSSTPWQFCY